MEHVIERSWRTYSKAALFIGPAVAAWAFLAVFVFPKLQQIWRDADLVDHRIAEFQWIIGALQAALANSTIIFAVLVALLIALEFSGERWARYRRAAVGALVFVLNSAIVVGLLGSVIVAAIAGPALATQ